MSILSCIICSHLINFQYNTLISTALNWAGLQSRARNLQKRWKTFLYKEWKNTSLNAKLGMFGLGKSHPFCLCAYKKGKSPQPDSLCLPTEKKQLLWVNNYIPWHMSKMSLCRTVSINCIVCFCQLEPLYLAPDHIQLGNTSCNEERLVVFHSSFQCGTNIAKPHSIPTRVIYAEIVWTQGTLSHFGWKHPPNSIFAANSAF